MPYVVGLTGGIGSGKSTVADFFNDQGADVIDADKISHDLTAQGKAGLAKIIESFGDEYLDKTGNLNRAKLREVVFSNQGARKKLELLLHPLIDEELNKLITRSSHPYVLLVIPLLLETGNYLNWVNRILVVDCEEQQQIDRVRQRSNLDVSQIKKIIDAQMPRTERLKHADDVIINNADLNSLQKQVNTLHCLYLEKSKAK